MGAVYRDGRRCAHGTLALVLAACGSASFAQTPAKQPPPPTQPDTTTVVEHPDEVPPPPVGEPAGEPVQPAATKPNAPEPTSPEHVPQDASGFHLSTLETKDLSLLYIDPIQTYLTPYIARS